ncbi:hypothetical protein PDN41_06485 [Bacillus cereus]|nr:hypothetical protein [Bacillus cereus]
MVGKKYLNMLKKVSNPKGFFGVIQKIFEDFYVGEYYPAIIEEGKYTRESGTDFYLKLVLKHQSVPINKTWLKNNLIHGISDPYDVGEETVFNNDAFIHNVITTRNYKMNSLYQLNPLLVTDAYSEYENKNNIYVNAYFNNEYSTIKGKPVLKELDSGNLGVFKNVFKDFINKPEDNCYPKYELVAEFEYRSHEVHIEEMFGEIKMDMGLIEVESNKNNLYVRGSVKIPYVFLDNKQGSNIKVIDLFSKRERKHNPNNFNGDSEEGFVCFKKPVVSVLSDYFLFYDIEMIDKNNHSNRYLVDEFEDKIVLFEAEYNKLPNSIKDKIDEYNYIPDVESELIISKAMYRMQLEGSWNWDEELLPDKKLANTIKMSLLNKALDVSLSFIYPSNMEMLQQFILKLESITDIKLDNFDISNNDVKRLISVRKNEHIEENLDLIDLYMKYCYTVNKEIEND